MMHRSREEAKKLLVKIQVIMIAITTLFVIVFGLFSSMSIYMILLILSPMFFSVIGVLELSKDESFDI